MSIERSSQPRPRTRPLVLAIALAIGAGAATGTTPGDESRSGPGGWYGSAERSGFPAQVGLRSGPVAQRLEASLARLRDGIRGGPDIVVENCNDAGPGSLRQALADLPDGGSIDLSGLMCSQITLTTGALQLPVPGVSTERGFGLLGPGRDQLRISGNDSSQILVGSGDGDVDDAVYMMGLTLRDGVSSSGMGGCIELESGTVYLMGSRVTGCRVEGAIAMGGGVAAGNVLAKYSEFADNSVQASKYGLGGGISVTGVAYVVQSAVTGNSVTVLADDDNLAASGGGISAKYGAIVGLSVISGNSVTIADGFAGGGGLATPYGYIVASRFEDNTVVSGSQEGNGGAMRVFKVSALAGRDLRSVDAGGPEWLRSLVSGADGLASGRRGYSPTTHVRYSEFSGNSADIGGAVAFAGGTEADAYSLVVSNSTISGNSAVTGGGGISVGSGHFGLFNSTVADNTAPAGGGLWIDTSPAHLPTWIMVSSIVANNTGADIHSSLGATLLGENNLVMDWNAADVVLPPDTLTDDPQLGPLAFNAGGYTRTHAIEPGSPALDAGAIGIGSDYDQRLYPHTRLYGAGIDIGAFEYNDVIFHNGFQVLPGGSSKPR